MIALILILANVGQLCVYTIVIAVQPAEMTEEQLMKRKKKALRRKQLEVEKTERDKVGVGDDTL